MAGYTRQSIADIINGSEVTAPPINAEFNQLASAFNATTGHTHDGLTGNSPKISLTTSISGYLPAVNGGVGGKNNVSATTTPTTTNDASEGYAPGSLWENTTTGRIYICVGNTSNAAVWRELLQVETGNKVVPVTTNSVDLGSPTVKFQDLFLSGGISAAGNVAVGGTTTLAGATALSSTLSVSGASTFSTTSTTGTATFATVDVNGGAIDGTTIGASVKSSGKFTTLESTSLATLDSVNIDGGNIDGAIIGASSKAAGSFTTVTTTGQATLATADIGGGTADNLVIGSTTANAVTGTTIRATTKFLGALTGAVTGNVIGNVTGDVIGDVTGDLAGNVTANSGSSSFNNVVVNGSLNMNAGTTATIQNLSAPVNNNDAARKIDVDTAVANLLDSAPEALNTLNELAAALADDDDAFNTLNTAINTKLTKAGDTMSGNLAMGSNKITGLATPTASADAASKGYADTGRDSRVAKAGDTMSGNLAMGSNKITGLATPTANADASNKSYVDSILGSATSAASSASAAATSATQAASSNTSSGNSAVASAASAASASTSASNAASSAASAAASFDAFDDKYLGVKSTAPTADNDGDALSGGTLYFDSSLQAMRVYTASGWLDVSESITQLPVNQGGTGATTAAAARSSLDVDQAGTALALSIALG